MISKNESIAKKGAAGGDKGDDSKRNYSFLIYNISICVYNIIRPFFRKGWLHHFIGIVEDIDKLLEDVEEPNQDWRARYIILIKVCMGAFQLHIRRRQEA